MSVSIRNCGNCGSHLVVLPSQDPNLDTDNLQGVACPHCLSKDIGPIPQETVIYVDEAVIVDENGDYKVINLTEPPEPESSAETEENPDDPCTDESTEDFRCVCCKKKFMTLSMLNKHYKYMQKEKVNMCFLCKRTFKFPCTLKDHYETHLNYKRFECDFCKKKFPSKNSLNSHLRTHVKDKVYNCEFCDMKFRRLHNLEDHYKLHTGEKPYPCPVCNKGFFRSVACSRHQSKYKHKPSIRVLNPLIRIPYAERKFFCELCGKRFMMECMLLGHYHRHPSAQRYVCPDENCKMFYLSEDRIIKHIDDHETKNLKYQAHVRSETIIRNDTAVEGSDTSEVSNKKISFEEMKKLNLISEYFVENNSESCPNLEALDIEEPALMIPLFSKSNNNSVRFSCEICQEKTYKFPYSLTEHYMSTHTGEKPWECASCKEKFHSRKYFEFHRSLSNHTKLNRVKIHKNKFACEICDKGFDWKGTLLTHYNKHKEAVRYKCKTCQIFFLGNEQLIKHMAEHSDSLVSDNTNIDDDSNNQDHLDTFGESDERDSSLGFRKIKVKSYDEKYDKSSLYTCEICQKIYKLSFSLSEHYMVHHTKEKAIECTVCKKQFPSKRCFNRHKQNYNHCKSSILKLYKKKFVCEICGKKFLFKGTLLFHYSKHPNALRYMCKICEMFFLGTKQLDQHIVEHDNMEDPLMQLKNNSAVTFCKKPFNDVSEHDFSQSKSQFENIVSSSSLKLRKRHRKTKNTLNKMSKKSNKKKCSKKKTSKRKNSLNATINTDGDEKLHTFFFNYGNNSYVLVSNSDKNIEDIVGSQSAVSPSSLNVPSENNQNLNFSESSNSPECVKEIASCDPSGVNPLKCFACHREFKFRIALKKHNCHKLQKTSEFNNTNDVSASAAVGHLVSSGGFLSSGMAPKLYFCETCNVAFMEEHHLNSHKEQHTRKAAIHLDEKGNKIVKYIPDDKLSKIVDSTSEIYESQVSQFGVQAIVQSSYGVTVHGVVTSPLNSSLTESQCNAMKQGRTYIINSDQLHKCILCEMEFAQQTDLQKHYEHHND